MLLQERNVRNAVNPSTKPSCHMPITRKVKSKIFFILGDHISKIHLIHWIERLKFLKRFIGISSNPFRTVFFFSAVGFSAPGTWHSIQWKYAETDCVGRRTQRRRKTKNRVKNGTKKIFSNEICKLFFYVVI